MQFRQFLDISSYHPRYEYLAYVGYRSHLLFFKALIFSGKKLWAFRFMMLVKFEIKKREFMDPMVVFVISIMKIMPEIYLLPRKVGGLVQGVPMFIKEGKQFMYCTKWTIKLLCKKHKRITYVSLTDVLLDAIKDCGLAIEQKLEVYVKSINNRHLLRFYKK